MYMTEDVKTLQNTVISQEFQIQELQRQLAWFKRQFFGTKSEKLSSVTPNNNPDLFGEEQSNTLNTSSTSNTSLSTIVPSHTRKVVAKGHGRNELPSHLEIKEKVIDIPEEQKTCSCCGKPKKCIGQDESEKLELVPSQYFIEKTIRPKYACSTCTEEGVTQSPMPMQLVPGGMYGLSVMIEIILGKFYLHLPFERQSQDLIRQGINLAPSVMVDWTELFCANLMPIIELMKSDILSGMYIHTDDTGIPVQIDRKKGKAHKGIMWVYVGESQTVLFEYTAGRQGVHPQDFLKEYQGYLHADGYSGYDKLYLKSRIKECMCWSHARRKIFDAYEAGDTRAKRPLQLIGWLFVIERYMKENGYDDKAKVELRQSLSKVILDKLHKWLKNNEYSIVPSSNLGKGMAYTLKNWQALQTYLEQGYLEMTNNLSERQLRKVVLGRKNWMMCGSENGARRAATLYSIVATCKLLNIDPYKYLADVLMKLSHLPIEKVHKLTPLQWKKSNP